MARNISLSSPKRPCFLVKVKLFIDSCFFKLHHDEPSPISCYFGLDGAPKFMLIVLLFCLISVGHTNSQLFNLFLKCPLWKNSMVFWFAYLDDCLFFFKSNCILQLSSIEHVHSQEMLENQRWAVLITKIQ